MLTVGGDDPTQQGKVREAWRPTDQIYPRQAGRPAGVEGSATTRAPGPLRLWRVVSPPRFELARQSGQEQEPPHLSEPPSAVVLKNGSTTILSLLVNAC